MHERDVKHIPKHLSPRCLQLLQEFGSTHVTHTAHTIGKLTSSSGSGIH